MIIIDQRTRQLLIEDALNTFPDECCGFLFGREERDGTRLIIDILVVDNAKAGDKTRRFEISPQDYMTAETHALEHDWLLLGIYHSHPKHPAIPSETDRLSAQPFFSYVIISVIEGNATKGHPPNVAPLPHSANDGQPSLRSVGDTTELRSWLLNEQRQFEEEKIIDYQYT